MDIIIQSLGFKASQELEAFINQKLEGIDKEIKVIRVNVMLFIGPDSNPDRYYCEMRLEIPGNDLFVKRASDTFEKAIVDAADTLQRNVRKSREKQVDRNRGSLG